MQSYPRSTNYERGTWNGVRSLQDKTASFCCPECGAYGSLEGHTVKADGTVSPSVWCACGFHEHIKLEGWQAFAGLGDETTCKPGDPLKT